MKTAQKLMAVLVAAILMSGMMFLATAFASDVDPFGKYETPIEISTVKNLGSGALDFPGRLYRKQRLDPQI
jgi:hypothetical protein